MKKTLNQEFLSEVTFEPTYPRPSFTLPDLSGPDGNTFVLASKIYDTLRGNDFYPEATLLCGGANYNFFMAKGPSHSALIFKTKAEEHANLINLFVALENNHHDVYDEDEDYVYIKQKKQKPVRNLPLFKQLYLGHSLSDTELEKIYSKDEKHFSQTNNYGRNVFYYCSSPKIMNWLIEKNETEQFIPNLFKVDHFHQTALHACNSMEPFTLMARHMFKVDPIQTHEKLFQQDVFGNSCFITMSRIFDKELKSITKDNIQNLVKFLATVVNIAPETSEELLGKKQLKKFLEGTSYYEKAVLNNHKEGSIVLTIQSQIEQELMELILPKAQKQTLKGRL